MLISFVIPFHTPVTLLQRCLESVATQTDGDFEAIVVDDGSPEDGEATTHTYGPRFRYVRQDRNRGLIQARVRGLREARGEYIVSLDADDYLLPDVVAEIRRASTDAPDIIAYNIGMDFDGRIEPHWCRHRAGECSAQEALQRILDRKMHWNLCGKAIRRETWLRTAEKLKIPHGLYLNTSEDFYACLPILMESKTVRFIDYPGYRYWQNTTSICNARKTWTSISHDTCQTLRATFGILLYMVHERKSIRESIGVIGLSYSIIKWSFWELRHA